jgi:4-carboxymuconolactone decarboxylase
LWLRPALAARDRSLVTVSALIASGQVAQITYHLNRAMDNGLTQQQASEVVTHKHDEDFLLTGDSELRPFRN